MMAASAQKSAHKPVVEGASEQLSGARPQEQRLDALRRQAARCRTAERLDLFQACSLLSPDRRRAPEVYARALLRTLGQALGRRPVIHGPGAVQRSFDELWLLQMIARLECGDTDSFTFLVSRRVPHAYRRSVAFLIHGLIAPPEDLPGQAAGAHAAEA